MTAMILGINHHMDLHQPLPPLPLPPLTAATSHTHAPATNTTIGTLPDRYIQQPHEQEEGIYEEYGGVTHYSSSHTLNNNNNNNNNTNNLKDNTKGHTCAFCATTTSPTWKKGPGKGYLCNICATSWLNRQRVVAQAKAKTEYKKVMSVNNTSNNNNNTGNNNNNNNNNTSTPTVTKKDRHGHGHGHGQNANNEAYDEIYYDEKDPRHPRNNGVGENNYYCRYCDTTWPLSYFRNRQQFGAHCSNCSRKRKPRDEPNPDPPSQRPRKKSRKPSPNNVSPTGFDDSQSHSGGNSSYEEEDYIPPSSLHYDRGLKYDEYGGDYEYGGSSTSSFEKGLMERLLNVVENKLVEVNELELIRKELQIMKSELLQREDRRQLRLGEVKNMIMNGVTELRIKMLEELANKENACRKELEEMRNGMMVEFVLKEQVIRNTLDDHANPNHHMVQQQLQDMRMSFERKLEMMKGKLGSEVDGMDKLVTNGVMKCEANIQDLLSELGAELNYQLQEVRMRFLALEKVIKDDPRKKDDTANSDE